MEDVPRPFADTGRTETGTALADTVVLDPGIKPEDIRANLIDAVNLGWRVGGNDGRCNVPANFVGWLLQEHDRLAGNVAALVEIVRSSPCPYNGRATGATVGECQQCSCSSGLMVGTWTPGGAHG